MGYPVYTLVYIDKYGENYEDYNDDNEEEKDSWSLIISLKFPLWRDYFEEN